MSYEKKPHLPIGYWIKKVDELLTHRINRAQEANGLSRTEWQMLNLLSETSSASRAEVMETLHPFGDEKALGSVIGGLLRRGFIEEEGSGSGSGQLRLTDEGRAVHAAALEVQKKIRQQAVQGITEDDYATTIRVLQQMVANLTDRES